MELDEKEVSLLVDGLRCATEKWKGMLDEAATDERLRGSGLFGILGAQIERAEALKARLIDAEVIEVITVRSMP